MNANERTLCVVPSCVVCPGSSLGFHARLPSPQIISDLKDECEKHSAPGAVLQVSTRVWMGMLCGPLDPLTSFASRGKGILRPSSNHHSPLASTHPQVKVPRPPQPDRNSAALFGTADYGHAFVMFRDVASAQVGMASSGQTLCFPRVAPSRDLGRDPGRLLLSPSSPPLPQLDGLPCPCRNPGPQHLPLPSPFPSRGQGRIHGTMFSGITVLPPPP